jgi:lysophospholipase
MRLILTPDNPVPEGAMCLPVVTNDGQVLRTMVARAPKPAGTVVILGGRADYLERYFETSRDMMARGLCVAALDFRGQGGSQRPKRDPERHHVRSFSAYDEDLRSFMTQVVVPNLPPPYYLLAHSTGGTIALRALLKHNWFSKAVLTAPLLDVHYRAWPVPVVQALTWGAQLSGAGRLYLPGIRRKPFGRADFEGNPLTGDRRRWMRDCGVLEHAPELGLGGPTYGWLRAALNSFTMFRRLKRGSTLRCPTLAVLAGLDQVVDNQATRDLERHLGLFATVTIPESRHEILNETDDIRAQFLAVFDSFIGARQAARPAEIAFAV